AAAPPAAANSPAPTARARPRPRRVGDVVAPGGMGRSSLGLGVRGTRGRSSPRVPFWALKAANAAHPANDSLISPRGANRRKACSRDALCELFAFLQKDRKVAPQKNHLTDPARNWHQPDSISHRVRRCFVGVPPLSGLAKTA